MRSIAAISETNSVVKGHRPDNTLHPLPSISDFPVSAALLQRKTHCACGGGCPPCERISSYVESRNGPPTNDVDGSYEQEAKIANATPRAQLVPANGGVQMDTMPRSFFESRFGQDFSRVRIHKDARAAELAGMAKAHAYTVGH